MFFWDAPLEVESGIKVGNGLSLDLRKSTFKHFSWMQCYINVILYFI